MKVLSNYSINQVKKYFDVINMDANNHCYQFYTVLKACDSLLYRVRKKRRMGFWIVVDDSNNPLIIAPFQKYNKDEWIVAGYNEGYDFIDFIYGNVSNEIKKEAFWELVSHMISKGCKKLIWKWLDDKSISYSLLRNFNLIQDDTIENVGIDFEGLKFEEYEKSLSKHSRQNIRTAYNRLERENHSLEFKIFSSNEIGESISSKEAKKLAEEALNIYITRQAEQYHKGSLFYRFSYKYCHYLTKLIANGYGFFSVLLLDGKVAAFMEGFVNEKSNTIEIPRLAYCSDYSFFSPGMLLVNETIKSMSDNGKFNRLDLCRGTEDYKYKMGGTTYITHNIVATFR